MEQTLVRLFVYLCEVRVLKENSEGTCKRCWRSNGVVILLTECNRDTDESMTLTGTNLRRVVVLVAKLMEVDVLVL